VAVGLLIGIVDGNPLGYLGAVFFGACIIFPAIRLLYPREMLLDLLNTEGPEQAQRFSAP
jgi:hypothetical protein